MFSEEEYRDFTKSIEAIQSSSDDEVLHEIEIVVKAINKAADRSSIWFGENK